MPWIWFTTANICELYVTIALELFAAVFARGEAPRPDDNEAGFPRARLRNSLVRRMYSLRHEASPVKRVKNRCSRNCSLWSEIWLEGDANVSASCPGKNLEKADLQA